MKILNVSLIIIRENMKIILFFGIIFLTVSAISSVSAYGELREVTFFNPPDAFGTISFQELQNVSGNIIAVKTYYYREKNPKILDRIVLTGENNNILRIFDCDFFGLVSNPRYLCLDGDYNIIMEKEKPVFVPSFMTAEKVVISNFFSAGFLIKTVKIIYECSNALKWTGLTNCRYVW